MNLAGIVGLTLGDVHLAHGDRDPVPFVGNGAPEYACGQPLLHHFRPRSDQIGTAHEVVQHHIEPADPAPQRVPQVQGP